jgi:hypothetical protein
VRSALHLPDELERHEEPYERWTMLWKASLRSGFSSGIGTRPNFSCSSLLRCAATMSVERMHEKRERLIPKEERESEHIPVKSVIEVATAL